MKVGTKLELCLAGDYRTGDYLKTHEGVVVQDSLLHYAVWTASHNELIKFDKMNIQFSESPRGWSVLKVEGIYADMVMHRYSRTIKVYDCDPVPYEPPAAVFVPEKE